MQAEKICPGCKTLKQYSEFVTTTGETSRRGKYCLDCHLDSQRAHLSEFLSEFGSCLYCGVTAEDLVQHYVDSGRKEFIRLVTEHMDPKAWGASDSPENLVWVCEPCNARKGDMLFDEWLETLAKPRRVAALAFYVGKQGRTPEEFVPVRHFDRRGRIRRGVGLEPDGLSVEVEQGWFRDVAEATTDLDLEQFGLVAQEPDPTAWWASRRAFWRPGMVARDRIEAYRKLDALWRQGKIKLKQVDE